MEVSNLYGGAKHVEIGLNTGSGMIG